ncbi:MAG: TOBE domain-containing protein, partial [Candidatus Thorarchaeota archaeon]
VQQFAPPREIYAFPQTLFVADFIGQCTFVDGEITAIGDYITVKIPNDQVISGKTTVIGYPFDVGEEVKCAIRPEDLLLSKTNPDDNEITGTVTRTIYVGNSLEVYFRVGDIDAQALLEPDFQTSLGSDINLYAPRNDVMVLPVGGVESLRKIPGHPMFDAPQRSSSPSNA